MVTLRIELYVLHTNLQNGSASSEVTTGHTYMGNRMDMLT